MTERKKYRLINERVRANAMREVQTAPDGWIVRIEEPNRTNSQNSKMWCLLADVARAKPEGRQWTPETWKSAFLHYLGHQVMFAEGLDGSGPFPVGFRSSHLTVRQMADLITCIMAYGDTHGVEWSEARDSGFMERDAA